MRVTGPTGCAHNRPFDAPGAPAKKAARAAAKELAADCGQPEKLREYVETLGMTTVTQAEPGQLGPTSRFTMYVRSFLDRELREARHRDQLFPVPTQGRWTADPPVSEPIGPAAREVKSDTPTPAEILEEKELISLREREALHAVEVISRLPERHRIVI